MLLLVKNIQKKVQESSKAHMDLRKKKEDYFGIGDFPQYQEDFFPVAELNAMKLSMCLWAIWISLSCFIWVAPQAMQGMFLNTTTGNRNKNMKMEYMLKFSHYL